MLRRRYILHADIGGCDYPFVIHNTGVCFLRDADIANVSEEEVAAPGLQITPFCSHSKSQNDDVEINFRDCLKSSYLDEALPDEIKDAICGRSDSWKVIRCVPEKKTVFFVVINPERIKATVDAYGDVPHGESLEEELANGYVWVFLDCSYKYSVSVSVLHDDEPLGSEKYEISRISSTWFEFTEYNQDGLFRHNEVKFDDSDEAEITVTEFI